MHSLPYMYLALAYSAISLRIAYTLYVSDTLYETVLLNSCFYFKRMEDIVEAAIIGNLDAKDVEEKQ